MVVVRGAGLQLAGEQFVAGVTRRAGFLGFVSASIDVREVGLKSAGAVGVPGRAAFLTLHSSA